MTTNGEEEQPSPSSSCKVAIELKPGLESNIKLVDFCHAHYRQANHMHEVHGPLIKSGRRRRSFSRGSEYIYILEEVH